MWDFSHALTTPPQLGGIWNTVPDRISAWSWQVLLSLFNHHDADDAELNTLAEDVWVYETLFPSNC
jgi:hypothetical protein